MKNEYEHYLSFETSCSTLTRTSDRGLAEAAIVLSKVASWRSCCCVSVILALARANSAFFAFNLFFNFAIRSFLLSICWHCFHAWTNTKNIKLVRQHTFLALLTTKQLACVLTIRLSSSLSFKISCTLASTVFPRCFKCNNCASSFTILSSTQ